VALRAAHDLMQAHQRKLGEVVIEHDAGAPFHLAMTCFAPTLELAGVRVFALVAARAVLGELLGRRRGGVTGVAIYLGVGALEGKLVAPGVIVILHLPAVVAVAVFALRAEARRMAASCTRCPLYRNATQTVFGEGPDDARLVLVGETPGDREDRRDNRS